MEHTTPTVIDPRPAFAGSLALTRAAVAAVRPDQLANPTPCGTFSVAELLGHLLFALDRAARVGRNENPFAGPEHLEPDDGDWVGAWDRLEALAVAAWVDDATLTRPTPLPWAAESGALALRSYVAELIVHTWDLAQGTEQRPAWDDDIVALSLAVMRQILPAEGRREMFEAIRATMPEEARAMPDPYDAAVPVAADAALIDQLVAHVGRRPA